MCLYKEMLDTHVIVWYMGNICFSKSLNIIIYGQIKSEKLSGNYLKYMCAI